MKKNYTTQSEQDTIDLGRRLGATLQPGATVLLSGDLGAGKTVFVCGLAKGLGLDDSAVNSPTFTLIQEYRGALTLFHVDLYRLARAESDDLGLEELASERSIVAIEWAEKLTRPWPGPNPVCVSIEDRGDDVRAIRIE